jgi:hypothetical protein
VAFCQGQITLNLVILEGDLGAPHRARQAVVRSIDRRPLIRIAQAGSAARASSRTRATLSRNEEDYDLPWKGHGAASEL